MTASSPRPAGPSSRAARTPDTAPKHRTAKVAAKVCAYARLLEKRATGAAPDGKESGARTCALSENGTYA